MGFFSLSYKSLFEFVLISIVVISIIGVGLNSHSLCDLKPSHVKLRERSTLSDNPRIINSSKRFFSSFLGKVTRLFRDTDPGRTLVYGNGAGEDRYESLDVVHSPPDLYNLTWGWAVSYKGCRHQPSSCLTPCRSQTRGCEGGPKPFGPWTFFVQTSKELKRVL